MPRTAPVRTKNSLSPRLLGSLVTIVTTLRYSLDRTADRLTRSLWMRVRLPTSGWKVRRSLSLRWPTNRAASCCLNCPDLRRVQPV